MPNYSTRTLKIAQSSHYLRSSDKFNHKIVSPLKTKVLLTTSFMNVGDVKVFNHNKTIILCQFFRSHPGSNPGEGNCVYVKNGVNRAKVPSSEIKMQETSKLLLNGGGFVIPSRQSREVLLETTALPMNHNYF